MGTLLKLTYQDYKEFPEDGKRYQLLDGDLYMSPAPSFWHQEILLRLAVALRQFVEQGTLGSVAVAPVDVVLDNDNVCQSDILFVAAAHRGIIRDEGVFGAPDLCVEILSPSSRKLDLEAKRSIYARCDVNEYWIADPDARTVTLYCLRHDATTPHAVFHEAQSLASPLLPGFELSIKALFARN
jgi:Uma2 family endonuclease